MRERESLGFHCEHQAHDRCVTRGCSCYCHAADAPPRIVTAPRIRPADRSIVGDQRGGYSAPEIIQITGLSYRQIDYWARTGVLAPSIQTANGSGSQRRWSEEDLRVLLVAKRLLEAGLSLASVRGIGEELRDIPTDEEGFVLIDSDHVTTARNLGQLRDELESGNVVHVMRIAAAS